MNYPSSVREVLCQILRLGLLQVRNLANESPTISTHRIGDAVDHLHNLPDLIAHHDTGKLLFYWEVERPAFRESLPERERLPFEELWDRLEPLLLEPAVTTNDDAARVLLDLLKSSRDDLG